MSVNGIDKSSISRIKNLSWNTIERWLERASKHAHHFNHRYLKGYEITEVQADEIRTFVDSKLKVTWLFTAIEVSSRLWISMVVGKRTYQNVKMCLWQFLSKGRVSVPFLFTTDGFDMYRWFVQRYLKGVAIYGQIIKKRSKNRVLSVDRTLFSGTQDDLKQVLLESEDSHTLNTSFVERHSLIIRQGCAYLRRKTPSHARDIRTLEEQLAPIKAVSSTSVRCQEILQVNVSKLLPTSGCKLEVRIIRSDPLPKPRGEVEEKNQAHKTTIEFPSSNIREQLSRLC